MDEIPVTQPTAKESARRVRQRKRDAMVERRNRVSELYRQGLSQQKIAEAVGVEQATVSTDIHALIAEWGRTAGINISAHIATELSRINQLEGEARRAYELSKQPKRVASARKMTTPVETEEGPPLTVETSTASATEYYRPEGDPRFLTVINQCINSRMKLLGLNGMPDEAAEKKNKATTFSDFVAAHLEEQENRKFAMARKVNELPAKS